MSLLVCHALHIMSSCAFHLHTCSSHASEHFPRCPFCNPAPLCHPVSLSTSFRMRVLKFFGLDRDLPCGLFLLSVLPVKFRAIWTSFDTPTVNRGTKKASCVLQPNTLPKWPKTHLNPLQHLGRLIMIAWPQTAPHKDIPSSLCAYIKTPPFHSRVFFP